MKREIGKKRRFARTAHSFACFALLAPLPSGPPHAFVSSLADSLIPKLVRKCTIRCLKTTWFCPTVRRHLPSTVGQNNKEYRLEYWATRSSLLARSFACTTHLFACSALLASLARSAAHTRSLAQLAHSRAHGTVIDYMTIYFVFFFYSGPQCGVFSLPRRCRRGRHIQQAGVD